MLTLGIRYLTGCVVASDPDSRIRVEWPPHPRRVFMALAAAHFQTHDNFDFPRARAERAALEWLENLVEQPAIRARSSTPRATVTHYVPVNDDPGDSSAPVQSAPGISRKRQPRNFARAWLDDEVVFLFWKKVEPPADIADALATLCGKVTRIGHSISLVQMWLEQNPEALAPTWLPDNEQPTRQLRIAAHGTLDYLERQFNRTDIEEFWRLNAVADHATDKKHRREARAELRDRYNNRTPVRLPPDAAAWHGYREADSEPEPEAPGSCFDPRLMIFELRRGESVYRSLDVIATLQVTARLREALFKRAAEEPRITLPESVTGHRSDGTPSDRPHVAIVPLPFAGYEHADGRLMGIALALPRDFPADDRRALLRALARVDHLALSTLLGKWQVVAPDLQRTAATLLSRTWTGAPRGARQWATMTPFVSDRHAKAKDAVTYREEIAADIRAASARIGIDTPVQVVVTSVSAHLGVPPAHQFPRLTRKDGSERRHTHAILIFEEPVAGPLLIGAGRYRGYGFCRPLESPV